MELHTEDAKNAADAATADLSQEISRILDIAKAQLEDGTRWLMANGMSNFDNAGASSHDYLQLFGLTAFALMWAKMARAALQKEASGDRFFADKLTTADQWLQENLDPLIASTAFRQNSLLVITFDESVDADTSNGGGHVITVVISPQAKQSFQSNTLYQHPSLLRSVEETFGLPTTLGAAATAPAMSD